ncbi:MAG: type II toxin-antitoxin system VapC family toxin [Deltaproteobacteria bacterium]|nr:type II toxin-antitoxin system VapC family toxin [Deltaproteobacteria bacterium]
MAERLFLDSNIIMYAIGGSHPLRRPCAAVIERIQARRLSVVTNTEIVQEILYRYRALGKAALALEVGALLMAIADEVFGVLPEDMRLAMELIRRHPAVNTRDAIHCATMVRTRTRTIISADRHFDQFPALRRLDPKDFAETTRASV